MARIAEIAEEQWGLVTRRQLALAGVPQTTVERLTAPQSTLERVAHGVYHLEGAPTPDHLELRAAWLQLAPEVQAWKRKAAEGVVSHRSAAALYGIGHLPADQHEFTVQHRKQTKRSDVRLHRRRLDDREWIQLRGLPVTRPARIASDLLYDHEDPAAVAADRRGRHSSCLRLPRDIRPESLAAFRAIRAPAKRRTGTASVAARPRR